MARRKQCPAGLKVSATNEDWGAWEVRAFLPEHQRVGRIGGMRTTRGGAFMDIHEAGVRLDLLRCGIGTKMYEAAAALACRNGEQLRSDKGPALSDHSRGFWEKQVARGRAHYDSRAERFVLASCASDLGRWRRR
jgi:GNAT superfamily N-acetyltransferase